MRIFILALFLCVAAASTVNAEVCQRDHFWSSFLQSCEECGKCVHPDVVIRPCQAHTDTMCGPLSDLNIDWTWLKKANQEKQNHNDPEKEMLNTFRKNMKQIAQHEAHVREKQKHQQENIPWPDSTLGANLGIKKSDSDDVVWEKLKGLGREWEGKVEDDLTALERQKHPDGTGFEYGKLHRVSFDLENNPIHLNGAEAMALLKSVSPKRERPFDANNLQFDENDVLVRDFGFSKVDADDIRIEEPLMNKDLTSTERFVLDWQTIIVGAAVASVLVFFVVAAVYSLQHTGAHWRKLKRYFDADVEELQTWLSKDKKGSKSKLPSSGIYRTTTEVVHSEGSHCKYLERIISLNGQNKMNRVPNNVYSNRSNTAEAKPLCQRSDSPPSVHKQLGDHI